MGSNNNMNKPTQRVPRRQQILECLAAMLEEAPGSKVTTAALAEKVGVSEAALYRHFPSKTKMFEGLVEFMEHTIFSRIKLIISDIPTAESRCEQIILLLLNFTERNPGITRIMTGDALIGDTARLRTRVIQFFDRLETQLKQLLRDAEHHENLRTKLPANVAANLLLCVVEGKISQFVRSGFKRQPTENWPQQWQSMMEDFFITTPERHAV